MRWDALRYRDQLDVAEACIVEAAMNGSWSSTDAILDSLQDALAEAVPTQETWPTSPEAVAGQATAERIFGGPAPPRRRDRTVADA